MAVDEVSMSRLSRGDDRIPFARDCSRRRSARRLYRGYQAARKDLTSDSTTAFFLDVVIRGSVEPGPHKTLTRILEQTSSMNLANTHKFFVRRASSEGRGAGLVLGMLVLLSGLLVAFLKPATRNAPHAVGFRRCDRRQIADTD